MLIGTLMTGQIEHAGGQWVASKFILVGIPIAPTESALCMVGADRRVRGHPIPIYLKSVLIAYVRWASGLLFVIFGLVAACLAAEQRGTDRWICLIPTAILLTAYVISMTVLGRLSDREKRRRMLLGEITGFCADPRILSQKMTSEILDKLRQAAGNAGLNLSPEYWDTHIPDRSALGLVFVLARYEAQAGSSQLWARIAEDMWTILEKERAI